jgi:hypothetical protein
VIPDTKFRFPATAAPTGTLICSVLSISPYVQITDLKFASPGRWLAVAPLSLQY